MSAGVLVAAVIAGVAGFVLAERRPVFGLWWYGVNGIVCLGLLVQALVQQSWGWAAWWAASTIGCYFGWRDSRRKRKRKRALAALGNKARARIAAMLKRAREAARPRPVLRPQPQGASA